MKLINKLKSCKNVAMRLACMISALAISHQACADAPKQGDDPIWEFMQQSLQGIFGSGAGFWKFFILADIALATYASLKSKNPTLFVGVFMTALLPGYLVKRYVFPAA